MATQAQLDEKARQDRRGVQSPSIAQAATPAQLAEKRRQDDVSYFAATPAQLEEKRRQAAAQPSPFEGNAPYQLSTPAPPAYSADDAKRSALIAQQWRSRDPRSSSTHSLVPAESTGGRRTLLLIYIHGFMGNETSFQSFPAHVHNLLTIQLSETHVVHTKIYPRYRSRKAIDFARDDFSHWLEPHENEETDVVLLGHSMGGLLAAEVALQRPVTMATGQPFRHRLLGTINFDTPFLGMHPGVVVSGIGSLFRPAPERPVAPQEPALGTNFNSPGSSTYTLSTTDSSSQYTASTSNFSSPPPSDPYYNPPFPNDVRLTDRKGWSGFLHFVNKHSDGLAAATKQYVMSHAEFGGAMADYPGLKRRYDRIRALEDVDDITRQPGPGYHPPARRIRFVNYYTASSGRPKSPKSPKSPYLHQDMELESGQIQPLEVEMKDMTLTAPSRDGSQGGGTPRISVEIHDDGHIKPQPLDDAPEAPSPIAPEDSAVREQIENLGESSGVQNEVQDTELSPMRHIDSIPIQDDETSVPLTSTTTQEDKADSDGLSLQTITTDGLPPIPPVPNPPAPFNGDAYSDKDARKLAEKEHKRLTKVYNQAVKDRENAIKDRKKYIEKREKKAKQEQEKQAKADEKSRLKQLKEEELQRSTINPTPSDRRDSSTASTAEIKPKRDKKFCMLPPSSGGQRDKTWIRVYMEGVDEVGAHCGLFFPGPQYESLVGDVGERIAKWVEEDATRRAIAEAERSY